MTATVERRVVVLHSMVANDGRTAVLKDALRAMLDTLDISWRIELWAAATPQAARLVEDFRDPRLVLCGLPAWWARMPSSFHIPMSARRVDARSAGADLLVNCNNTRLRAGFAGAELHYVHHPAEAHQQDPNLPRWSRIVWRLGTWALPSGQLADEAVVLANSSFTAERVERIWGVLQRDVEVLRPPFHAVAQGPEPVDRAEHVVSLGAFVPAKRQDEQVAIARSMPETRFVLAGRSTRRPYMARLRRSASRAANVTLEIDPTDAERDDLLRSAAVFLHTRRGEHYGIAIAEAISAGCVPVVHDSGGARDLVASHAEWCLYSTSADAVTRLRAVLALSADQRAGICRELSEDLAATNAAAFRLTFAAAIDRALDTAGLR